MVDNEYWIVGTPGSGYYLIEALIRYTSNLDFDKNLKPTEDYLHSFHVASTATLLPTIELQDHRNTYELLKRDSEWLPDGPRVITVLAPMKDTKFETIFDFLKNKQRSMIFLSANDPVFSIISMQTANSDPRTVAEIFSPSGEDVRQWKPDSEDFNSLEKWEKREYLSHYIDYFFNDSANQFFVAEQSGAMIYFTESLYKQTKRTCTAIFNYLGIEIRDQEAFNNLVSFWGGNQYRINADYKTINTWMDSLANKSNLDTQLPLRSIIYEAIIQRYLRKQFNIELKCYGLNTFPTTIRELEQYYE